MEFAQGDIFLGRYEISHVIGRGAFGMVYRARHLRSDRDVAIKFLQMDDEIARARFEVEARVIARLTHPATVRVFDYGQWEDTPYMILDYVAGRTLRAMIDWMGPFPADRTVRVLTQILGSIEEAHSKGVVHRDLKPENIYLSQPDPSRPLDRVRVLDFGVAKILRPGGSGASSFQQGRLTMKGSVVGTLRYMSPEQVKGDDVGPETDLFSLGLIAFEMLVGEHAYGELSEYEIAPMLRDAAPLGLDGLRDLPSDLADIVRRLLEKDVRQRYRSADAVLRDLHDLGDSTRELELGDEHRPSFLAAGREGSPADERSYVSLFDEPKSTGEADGD